MRRWSVILGSGFEIVVDVNVLGFKVEAGMAKKNIGAIHEQEKELRVMIGDVRAAYDTDRFLCNHGIFVCVPWHSLYGVRNNSLKKAARYLGEKPQRHDLPKREELEETSRRFAVKYLLGVMNSSADRDFLRANRRNNVQLYPDDWKKLPIPGVPPAQQQPIIALVDQVLTAKRANTTSDISTLEHKLDAKISRLYGLTPEETRTVEEST